MEQHNAKAYGVIIQAWGEGLAIQYRDDPHSRWLDVEPGTGLSFNLHPSNYRIKPTPPVPPAPLAISLSELPQTCWIRWTGSDVEWLVIARTKKHGPLEREAICVNTISGWYTLEKLAQTYGGVQYSGDGETWKNINKLAATHDSSRH